MRSGGEGAATRPAAPALARTRDLRRVMVASTCGTVFEWYDFYLYAAVAPLLARKFFADADDATAFLFAVVVYSAGFLMRPFGAVLFGHLGDQRGRRGALLSTVLLMGSATLAIGLLPTAGAGAHVGPAALLLLRLLQGLAIGGEWGGAATYVAEHAPPERRGFYTAWIQITASFGLLLAIAVTTGVEALLGAAAFEAWGWRLPFLLSLLLVAASLRLRRRLAETPAFERLRAQGGIARRPLKELLTDRRHVKAMLVAIFGLVLGQAVIWYASQVYALLYLQQTLRVDAVAARGLFAAALVIACPFFVVFGALSDRVGRKRVILTGCLLAALTYVPVFDQLVRYANPQLARAQERQPVRVVGDPAECSAWLDSLGAPQPRSSCDVARRYLAGQGIAFRVEDGPAGVPAVVHVGKRLSVPTYRPLREGAAQEALRFGEQMHETLYLHAHYPQRAEPGQIDRPLTVLLLALLIIYVAMVYAPMAAALADLFPARQRYTAVSVAYHVGNGWFGGLVPTVAFATVAITGRPGSGLWYPVAAALVCAAVGALLLRDGRAEPAADARVPQA